MLPISPSSAAIRSTILDSIKSSAVLPARIAVDVDEGDDVDITDLTYPDPLGILRVLVRRASGLRAADTNLLSRNSSDPYVKIEIGQQVWKSPVIKQCLDPSWDRDNVVDLLVYDPRQKALITLWDKDKFSQDDLLGAVEPLSLKGMMQPGPALDQKLELSYKGRTAGSLSICSRWFLLTNNIPLNGIHPAVAKGPSQLVLGVKLTHVTDLPRMWKPPFVVQVTVNSEQVRSKRSHAPAAAKPVTAEVEEIVLRMLSNNVPLETISKLTGLKCAVVESVRTQALPGGDSQRYLLEAQEEINATHPTFNEIIRFMLPWTQEIMSSAFLALQLLDATDKTVGTVQRLRLSEIVGKKEVFGPFALSCGGDLHGKFTTKWMTTKNVLEPRLSNRGELGEQ